ncbi:hypothetical protein [Candidatus Nitrosotalea bavarica]|uniref:hypothetical protein n=1 Tax=Candidatus Nitrosotalea bavarica TaxID=1903277 RepID=UPI0010550BFB|nr:hypothetical protein [Candidatus Nitrosotalea bavarica]
MKSKLIASFMIILVLGIASLPLDHAVYGQTTTNTMKLSTKGPIAESSNFHGAIMWTVINGNNGIIIIQSPAGRGLAHISISQSTNCSSSTATCLMSTVTDPGQIGAFKAGDTARFAIDVNSNQETASILTGTLAGFDVTVNLTKTWSNNIAPATPVTPTNHATTNPVTPTTTPAVNSTSTNSTTTQTSGRHLTINLTENMGLAAVGH